MGRIIAITLASLLLLFHTPMSVAETATVPGIPTDKGKVSRAQFTTMVKQREPLDEVVVLEDGVSQVYFFTELRQLKGKTIVHRWEYNGKVVSEVAFKVAGNRWRVYSKKSLSSHQQGKWTVVVVDDEGWPYHAAIFQYGEDDTAVSVSVPAVTSQARVSVSIPK